ncbi:MAG: hypothetical protein GY798_21220, partial [Hyphomicrobiales bacterium]|nr:hypothetical protein [Hyphomicrobiales bacterium]
MTGAWALFLDRPDALRHFDFSVEGFWRSFRAIVLVIPVYLIIVLSQPATEANTAPSAMVVDVVLRLALDWVTLPIVLALAARPLGLEARYGAFVVARNWGSVLATAPLGVIGALVLVGLLGSEIANLLTIITVLVMLRYMYLIARRTLNVGPGGAVGIVVLDFAISLTIA